MIGRLDELRAWLGCRSFTTDFRPVPLREHAVFQGTVFRNVTIPCLPSWVLPYSTSCP